MSTEEHKKSIHDSDSEPSPKDMRSAKHNLTNESGEFDTEIIANVVARLQRKELMQSNEDNELLKTRSDLNKLTGRFNDHMVESKEHQTKVLSCLLGDEFGNEGLVTAQRDQGKLLIELHTQIVKKPTTKSYANTSQNSEVTKYVWMIVGGLIFAAWFIGTWISIDG